MKSNQKQTRDTVRDAAFRLFGRHGYDGVSIDTIARAVGLSKGALYWHFDGKEALFRECLEGLESLFDEHIIAPMQAAATPREQLDTFFRGVSALAEDERIADGIAGYWQEPYNSAVNRVFREQLGRQEDKLRQLLQQCLAGLARERGERSVADLETRSETLMTLMEAVLLPLRRRNPAARGAIIGELRDTVLKAY
ncbi:transcriptional regulator, TetR family [Aquisalimonas asiatica]|uniref:Transcriptional regulator, TetR family n=2 Tax=Aquisalimonas asiatica TaxID=406100 RepID=A0A1H8V380_9GAMM|nr:transcriptional regulator, TetR family [Aquisalimonas asiatica]